LEAKIEDLEINQLKEMGVSGMKAGCLKCLTAQIVVPVTEGGKLCTQTHLGEEDHRFIFRKVAFEVCLRYLRGVLTCRSGTQRRGWGCR